MNGNESKPGNKGGCHSAAWGRRVTLGLTLLLVTSVSFGQGSMTGGHGRADARTRKMTQELQSLSDLSSGTPVANQNVRVIVQFKEIPQQHHFDKVRPGAAGSAPASPC